MLAIIGASGKLGGATLSALLSNGLAEPASVVAITSSSAGSAKWEGLASLGVEVRHGSFEDASSLAAALAGVDRLFLVSTPRIDLDFRDAPEGQGREKHHRAAIDAARAAGVRHLYYSSLAFGDPSRAGVMRAHLRTEAYLASLADLRTTVLREGLYSESWPLYLGYYDPRGDDRGAVRLAGDGKVCWTAIADLGLASALVLTAPGDAWAGRTVYLSTPPATARTLGEVAALVAQHRQQAVAVEVVGRQAHETHYVEERKMDAAAVEWWASTYDALEAGECLVDDPTLLTLLQSRGRKPVPMEDVVSAMVTV